VPYHQTERKIITSRLDSKSILLGEDDIDDVEFLKEMFSSVDDSFSLTFVHEGKKVMEHLNHLSEDQLPCLIILDYNMPALNGAEILQQIKSNSRYNSIPTVIWSTSPSATYRIKCLDAGADDYVTKPSSVNELIETIRYMLSLC